MPRRAHTPLDQEWISEPASVQAIRRIRRIQRRFWIRSVSVAALLLAVSVAAAAASPCAQQVSAPTPCPAATPRLQTDQYTDPWQDLALSLNPGTRDRHAYVNHNPVFGTDPSGHCGPGGAGGPEAEDSCAVALSEYCRGKPAGTPYCPAGQHASQEQAQGHQQNLANAGKPGSSYVTPHVAQPAYMPTPTVASFSMERGPSILSLKNPITSFLIGDQANCITNPGWGRCTWAAVSVWKPAKAVKWADDAYDGIRGIRAVDKARDAKRVTSGDAVLGHYPEYVGRADELGARRFSVPDDVWARMTPAEQWAANRKFLDRTVARGGAFHLATPIDRVRPGSYYEKELQYLTSRGYRLNEAGTALVP